MSNNKISRRNLLRYFSATAGCFIVSASLTGLTGCAQPNNASPSQALFPQGVASGDPQTDAVILWTRVESALRSVDLTVQLAADENFVTLLAEQQILAEVEWDHTVRVLIDGLEPDTHYYYRFMTQDAHELALISSNPAADYIHLIFSYLLNFLMFSPISSYLHVLSECSFI